MARVGSLAPLAIAAAVVTAAVVGLVVWRTDGHAVMPGALHAASSDGDGEAHGGIRAHAELDDCEACHPGPFASKTASELCIGCHDDITRELADQASRHARNHASGRCLRCHTEHHGADGELTEVDRDHFDHEDTGFSLKAHKQTKAHKPFRCNDCHHGDTDHFAPGTCEQCHRTDDAAFVTEHVAAWGPACRACHDGVDRFGHRAFDHARTKFALVGKHATARCEQCHTKVTTAKAFAQAPSACVACHTRDDLHGGRLGKACETCHTATSWKDLVPGGFDHAKTRFPLTGAHVKVTCEDCHWHGRLAGTPRVCELCHPRPRDHFTGTCEQCHTTASWRGAKRPRRPTPARPPVPDATSPDTGTGTDLAPDPTPDPTPTPRPDTTTGASRRR